MRSSELSNSTLPVRIATGVAATRHTAIADNIGVSAAWLKFAACSVALLVPCFWQSHLVAGDLGSHIYNAWLVQQIRRGELPGLWIANQWNNVLFDYILSALGKTFSLHVSSKIAVSICVMVLFWGTFAFIRAVTGKSPWFLTPILAAVTYGSTFQQGLFNYYLSLGLAFFGLAIFLGLRGWRRLLGVGLAPLVLLAHPLGLAFLIGAALYIAAAEIVPRRFRVLPLLAAIAVIAAARQFFWHYFRVEAPEHTVTFYNGLDQLILRTPYLICVGSFGLFLAIAVLLDFRARRLEDSDLTLYALPAELYLLAEAAVLLLPDVIWWPQYAAPTSRMIERYTLISAVLLCCILGAIKPRSWHWLASAGIALIFFGLLYQDTAQLSRMQEQAYRLLHSTLPGQRVLVTIISPLKYRFGTRHIIDEACVGYCFMYGNYEAPSLQFRVRALPSNRYVMTSIPQAAAMERGAYVVQPQDLPASQIYQCGPDWTDLCMRPLQAGERNDRLGFHPDLGIHPEP